MYVATIPNRSSPPAILLRESYRAGGKVKSRTLTNLTHWPPAKIAALRRVLANEAGAAEARAGPDGSGAFEIQRSLPHGHAAAVLGTLRRLGLEPILAAKRSAARDAVVALIVARVIDPRSKLATARGLGAETAFTSLGEALGLSGATADELYAAMDWLLPRQTAIEQALAGRHLAEQTLVLYDVTSAYFEGRTCPLARLGHSRDGQKDKLQIVFGLLCNAAGCPVAVEVFDGNTADPKTLTKQIEKIQQRFGLQRVVLVGDRGMLTAARIEQELRPKGLDWITALRAPAIRALAEAGVVQPSLFDERDLAEITAPAYPGERLVACRNPLLAEERARKRTELLAATEKELDRIVAATGRSQNRLRGQDQIGLRVGKVLNRFKMGKHFQLEIAADSFRYQRDEQAIAAEAALDGIYIVRTSLPADTLKAEQTVRAYKGLAVAERAFRSLKTVDLKVRPIHHRLAERVRAHVLLCMLAYYVEWHMRQAWAALLFDDDDKPTGEARRTSVVARAQRSPRAARKAATQKTEHEQPVHSFQTLLADLATLAKNRVRFAGSDAATMTIYTQPTPLQQRALALLQVNP
jgi:transposase